MSFSTTRSGKRFRDLPSFDLHHLFFQGFLSSCAYERKESIGTHNKTELIHALDKVSKACDDYDKYMHDNPEPDHITIYTDYKDVECTRQPRPGLTFQGWKIKPLKDSPRYEEFKKWENEEYNVENMDQDIAKLKKIAYFNTGFCV